MALLFIDGFDHYTDSVSDLKTKWGVGSGGTTVVSSPVRNGVNALRLQNAQWLWTPTPFIFESVYSAVCGFGWRRTGSASTEINFYTINGLELKLVLSSNCKLYRGATLIGTGTAVLSVDTWYHIEIKYTIDNVSGSAIVNVNETEDINFSGDTLNQSSLSYLSVIGFYGILNYTYIDDVYICDQTGSINNDFLGDVVIEALYPNGNGNYSQFDGSDGNQVDNYLLVDEADPDDDSTYVESLTIGERDSFLYDNLSESPSSIKGIQLLSLARLPDNQARGFKNFVRISSTDYDQSEHFLSNTFAYERDILEENPNTVSAWTESDVNALEAGVKVES
jgi:hypothetical protein